jgi:hypothetical protein
VVVDKLKINLNMFGVLVLNVVGEEIDGVARPEWPVIGGCVALQAVDEANTPLPHCWP